MKRRIVKIAFPIALTSYIRSGLSSFKQFLIPLRLEMYGFTYSVAVSKYGMITRYGYANITFCKCFNYFF